MFMFSYIMLNQFPTSCMYETLIYKTINSTHSAAQMSTESAQTTCLHCYNLKHLQTPRTCRQSISSETNTWTIWVCIKIIVAS